MQIIDRLKLAAAYVWNRYSRVLIVYAFLLLPALWIGCSHLTESGPLWPDGPQYANAAAMIHDWLLSGDFLHPYEFAKRNYARFPAFHLPYHPPVYPGLLALFFTATGVSYLAARVFVALCLWICGCFFYAILTRTGVQEFVALGCSLLLITLPEIALWSRDAMSEVPGLALVLAGSYFFLVWLTTGRKTAYYAAFSFAEAAFLSRFLTAGVLPAWFLCALLAGRFRKLLAPWAIIPPALYLVCNSIWANFAIRFARYETIYGGAPPNTNYAAPLSWKIFAYYAAGLPAMVGWLSLAAACLGLFYTVRFHKKRLQKRFWLPWLLSYLIFVEVLGLYQENRYFIYALPVFPALAAGLFDFPAYRFRYGKYLSAALLAGCILWNLAASTTFPRGLVGYETIGRRLAAMTDPGNVLVASIGQSDLIFRYRSYPPLQERAFIRGDRSLAIRPPAYSDAPATMLARSSNDVFDIIRRGRVRYLVTCSPAGDPRIATPEMLLLDNVVSRTPASFVLIGQFPLHNDTLGAIHDASIRLWRFTGELLPGPSEIPVVVPTADLTIAPNGN